MIRQQEKKKDVGMIKVPEQGSVKETGGEGLARCRWLWWMGMVLQGKTDLNSVEVKVVRLAGVVIDERLVSKVSLNYACSYN